MTPFPTDEVTYEYHSQVFVTHQYVAIDYLRKINPHLMIFGGLSLNSTGINYYTNDRLLGKVYHETIGVGVLSEDYEDYKNHIQLGCTLGVGLTPIKKFNRLSLEVFYKNVFGQPIKSHTNVTYDSPYSGKQYIKSAYANFYSSYVGIDISFLVLKSHKT